MSNMKYSVLVKYGLYRAYIYRLIEIMIITVRIDELVAEKGRSFYWLSKQTQISHTTLWRLKKGKALGINFITLEKICQALGCEPGDVLKLSPEKKAERKKKS
jgi:putative transcriptional regulator